MSESNVEPIPPIPFYGEHRGEHQGASRANGAQRDVATESVDMPMSRQVPEGEAACDRRTFLRGVWVGGSTLSLSALALPMLTGCQGAPHRPLAPRTFATLEPRVPESRHPELDISPSDSADVSSSDPAPSQARSPLYPAPDLSEAQLLRHVAGVRPYRRAGVRLQREGFEGRPLVHNYGHGGAGITLSWGCAAEVLRLLQALPPRSTIAVVGAGISGLTTAAVLSEAGHRITLYSREFSPHTTSDVAGGQWCPSLVAWPRHQRPQLARILRYSYRRFQELAGVEWGIESKLNLVVGAQGRSGFERIPEGLLPKPQIYSRLPLPGVSRSGVGYSTLLIEPPRFLARLRSELERRGVTFIQKELLGLAGLRQLPQECIVNCMGLGSRMIFKDRQLIGVRGQLVHLKPQELPYLLSHRQGYLFARRDCLVLGGTTEWNVDDPTPQPATCRRLLERHRRFFG